MKKLLKKISLFFLSFLVLISSYLTILAPSANAQSTWYSQNPFEWYIKVFDEETSPPNEIFGERYTAAQVQWIIWSLFSIPIRLVEASPVVSERSIMCLFKRLGTNTVDISDCIGGLLDTSTKILNFIFPKVQASNNKSVVALVFNDTKRNPSGINYTKDLIKRFSPVSEVKAQTYGFSGLGWLQKYWKGFRDISYTLLVLVVIIFAFMIMFRVKLNPQTVISVQSALPKIIVALLLITFSYAIAGFAVDLSYVVAGLFTMLLKLAGFSTNPTNAWAMISGTGAGYLVGGFWIFFVMFGYGIMFIIAAVSSVVTTLLGGFSIFGALVSVIFIFVGVWVLILWLWYTIKIPYILIKTLISFYLSVITAPIQILAGTVVPSMGFGTWFKKLMADILVFPVTGLLFWFAWATLWSSFNVGWTVDFLEGLTRPETVWAPGIIGSAHEMTGIIFLVISFGIIVLIPKVPELLKSIIMGEKFSFGTAIGEAMGPLKAGWGMTGAPLQRSFQEISTKEMIYNWAGKVGAVDKFKWVPKIIKGAAQKMSVK